ncbi:MAG: hypothetical protein CVU97_01105 [Firmicutes bacterium HGW-Firmicutes-21]|nr:MAG: hypothetical protein CVU97_01105 [Firmicutes bacterium HGW-Firmicutes-21]
MTLLYGTGNQAKVEHMNSMLENTDIKIIGLDDLNTVVPKVDETGNDPLENAYIKAMAYYNSFKVPVFSCDSGLYIEGLEDSLQPGVHVRNIGGNYLNDDGMITYYSSLAQNMGGQCFAQYKNAICLIFNESLIFKHMGDDISGNRFIITAKPHPKRRVGFPLDSLTVHIESGKYYYDMEENRSSVMAEGFRNFFAKAFMQCKGIL